jgi:hypothetical protein
MLLSIRVSFVPISFFQVSYPKKLRTFCSFICGNILISFSKMYRDFPQVFAASECAW